MRRGVELLPLCIFACGETLPPAEEVTASDGGTTAADARAAGDAASPTDAAACDPAKPFVARKLAGDVNSVADEPSLALDDAEQQIFFTSARTGMHHIHVATRDGTGAFGGSTPLLDLVGSTSADGGDAGPSRELFVAASSNGNLLIFSTNREGTTADALDLWFTTRTNATNPWQAPKRVYSSSPVQDQAPFLEVDGTLWFSSGDGVSEADIYFARKSFQDYELPKYAEPPVNAENAEDSSPVVTRDGLRLYFATTRRRPLASRRFEIWTATRGARDGSFGDAVPLADLEGDFDQRPSWISADGCRLYFTRRAADIEVWVAERPK